MNLKIELVNLVRIIKNLDRKVVIIFLSVALIQTVSWYFTSRRFFRINLFDYFSLNPDVYLIEYLYWFIGDFFSLFLIPILIVKLIFKESISNFGLRLGDYKAGLTYTVIFIMVMLPLVWIVSSIPSFGSTYPHLQSARESWKVFFIYQTGMFIYMFSWEFIWRGFMLFGLELKFGYYSVLIQMIPFLILHNGKPVLETFGAIIAGIALGILALRTRSVYYCIIAHAGVMFSMDFISTLRFKAGEFGIGFNAFISILKSLF